MLSESINLSFSNNSGTYKNITKPINFSEIDALGVRLTFNSNFSVSNFDGYSKLLIELGEIVILYRYSSDIGVIVKSGTSVFILFNFFLGEYSNKQYMQYFPVCDMISPIVSDKTLNFGHISKFSLDTSDYFFAGIGKNIAGPKCSGNITADIYKVYF